jgi:outer membrane biosynthesis protein TonB
MLEKMLVLLERFVVAHELIAANSAKPAAVISQVVSGPAANDEAAEPEQKAPAKRTRATKPKAAPEPEPEQEEEEEAPKPKAKAKAKETPDLDTLREEIKTMATHIAEGDSDECADEFDDLLEDFKVRTVTKLADDDVEEFHAEAKKVVSKYYELED